MAKTLRSQNKCNDCRYTWYPRGKNLSRVCPSCGSENVAIVVNWTPIVAVGAIGLYLIFGGKSNNDPATGSQTIAPLEAATPAEIVDQHSAPPEPVATSTPQHPLTREEVIEPPRLPRSAEQEASSASTTPIEPSLTPVEATGPAATTPAPDAKVDEFERVYSDEEISTLEEQKQNHGNDPIVRSRLGLPSRETHKLVR